MKDMKKGNKLSANFKSTPLIVEQSQGGDVLVRNEETGQRLRRNVIHLKRIKGQWEVSNKN